MRRPDDPPAEIVADTQAKIDIVKADRKVVFVHAAGGCIHVAADQQAGTGNGGDILRHAQPRM